MICRLCKQRYGTEGVDYWYIKYGVCNNCKDARDVKNNVKDTSG